MVPLITTFTPVADADDGRSARRSPAIVSKACGRARCPGDPLLLAPDEHAVVFAFCPFTHPPREQLSLLPNSGAGTLEVPRIQAQPVSQAERKLDMTKKD